MITDGESENAHEKERQEGLLIKRPEITTTVSGLTHGASMNHCSINLEDTENGEIAMRIQHAEGFNPRSPAHKLAIQIVKWLDEQATSKKDLCHAPTHPGPESRLDERPH